MSLTCAHCGEKLSDIEAANAHFEWDREALNSEPQCKFRKLEKSRVNDSALQTPSPIRGPKAGL